MADRKSRPVLSTPSDAATAPASPSVTVGCPSWRPPSATSSSGTTTRSTAPSRSSWPRSSSPESATAALLLTYAGYAVASVLRPAGALLFGALGDRLGRRSALSAVVLLMSVSTAAIGLLPTHADIGVWAPVLLFTCRALQGLSAGGEYGGSASFLAEYAPPGRRALYTSWQTFTVLLSFLVGALLGAVLTVASARTRCSPGRGASRSSWRCRSAWWASTCA